MRYLIFLSISIISITHDSVSQSIISLDSAKTLVDQFSDKKAASLENYITPYLNQVKDQKNLHIRVYFLNRLIDDQYGKQKNGKVAHWIEEADSLFNCCSNDIFNSDPDSTVFYQFIQVKADHFYDAQDYQNAIKFNKLFLKKSEIKSDIDSLYASIRNSYLASTYLSMGNPDRALYYYQNYIDLLPSTLVKFYGEDLAHYYHILGWTYLAGCWYNKGYDGQNKEFYKKAVSSYNKAINTIGKLRNPGSYGNTISSTYYGLIALHQDYEYYDSALFYLKELEKYDLNTKDNFRSKILMLEGNQYLQLNDTQTALNKFRDAKSLHISQNNENHVDECLINNEIAHVLSMKGEFHEALKLVQHNLQILAVNHDVLAEAENPHLDDIAFISTAMNTLKTKAEILSRLSEENEDYIAKTIESYKLAIKLSLKNRRISFGTEAKQRYIQRHRQLIESALEFCYGLEGKVSEMEIHNHVLWFMENSKALLIVEDLYSGQVLKSLEAPPSIIKSLDSLELLRNELSEELRSDYTLTDVLEQIKRVEEEYDSLQTALGELFPNYYDLLESPGEKPLSHYQALLKTDGNVLSYFQGDSAFYLLAFDPTKAEFVRLADREQIASGVNQILDMSRNRVMEPDRFSEKLLSLYDQLIKPVDRLLAHGESISIVADGYLNYLPFDMLLTTSAPNNEYQNWPYLLKEYATSYKYSLQLSEIVQETNENIPKPYLGVAPDYGENEPKNLMVLRENPELLTTRDLGVLMFNKEEIMKVNDILDGEVLLDSSATKEHFLDLAKEYKVLHLSMHAYVDESNPDHTGLVFSGFDQNSQYFGNTGLLTMSELSNLSIGAELAILSACETGYGYLERGEGLISLGRAFKLAGCPTTTMSIWKANDYSTSKIMVKYAKYLAEGVPKDQALQQAKIDYLNSADINTSHPYFWAPFILHGNEAPLSFVSGNSVSFTWILSGLLLITFLTIALFVKLNSRF